MNKNKFNTDEEFDKVVEQEIEEIKQSKEKSWNAYLKATKLEDACKNADILAAYKQIYFTGFDSGGIYMSIRIAESMLEKLVNDKPTDTIVTPHDKN